MWVREPKRESIFETTHKNDAGQKVLNSCLLSLSLWALAQNRLNRFIVIGVYTVGFTPDEYETYI